MLSHIPGRDIISRGTTRIEFINLSKTLMNSSFTCITFTTRTGLLLFQPVCSRVFP